LGVPVGGSEGREAGKDQEGGERVGIPKLSREKHPDGKTTNPKKKRWRSG